ncbi:MAG: ATP-dependent Clp protease proteolytic subunit [Chlamydiia bacterium]|nr:ATP-dependent Clp protease proteolytic subunit [Chlamydiia bacterium]
MAQKSTSEGLRVRDQIEKTLLKSRRIFLSDGVDSETANAIIEKLWYLDIEEPGKQILLIINSPGGTVDSGFAIWDQVQMISSPVATLVTGLAASFGSVLSLCAPKGKRYATKNARIMAHQPLLRAVIRGQATDLEIQAREMLKMRKALVDLYAEATGKSQEVIESIITRDSWFSAQEALEFGLIDQIVSSFDEVE